MKNYYRLMLGRKSIHAAECFNGDFIGADFQIDQDLSAALPEQWQQFNKVFIPVFLAKHPEKTKIGAGLACGALWVVSKGICQGDIILCPDGNGTYRVAEVISDYYYVANQVLPHRRKVKWLSVSIARTAMSEALKNSTGSIGTVSTITSHHVEIEKFLNIDEHDSTTVAVDPVVEDPLAFALEKHLEDFLVKNWHQTELSQQYNIYEEDGELVGQQYSINAGTIDILAISKDKKRLLVVELKRGRASDIVVGQILRYMGCIKEQIAETDQRVEGVIIALEDDQKLRWALNAVPSVSFYRYELSFKLLKV
ncbi:MAG TPA: endonuclease NucS [Agitococcus sp.]|nr:endonuclease NucS [Agitococcus sp.]